ncbi:hypothetical protein F4778DRAFT_753099 [Xylariomycetidae sp. FL2044]|nr:hypothetical protein F4778DRAFT_753099 [Xylariomycetidae sp. FL2044]
MVAGYLGRRWRILTLHTFLFPTAPLSLFSASGPILEFTDTADLVYSEMLYRSLGLQFIMALPFVAEAQGYGSGPYRLHISSDFNPLVSGYAYPCGDTLAICHIGHKPARSSTDGFYFDSYTQDSLDNGLLSFNSLAYQASKPPANGTKPSTSSIDDDGYGPVGLSYDPGSNVAIPMFNHTTDYQVLGFDSETGNMFILAMDDTGTNPNSTSNAQLREYFNWYSCYVALQGKTRLLVSWVLKGDLGSPSTNPTCQAVNITLESAMAY